MPQFLEIWTSIVSLSLYALRAFVIYMIYFLHDVLMIQWEVRQKDIFLCSTIGCVQSLGSLCSMDGLWSYPVTPTWPSSSSKIDPSPTGPWGEKNLMPRYDVNNKYYYKGWFEIRNLVELWKNTAFVNRYCYIFCEYTYNTVNFITAF